MHTEPMGRSLLEQGVYDWLDETFGNCAAAMLRSGPRFADPRVFGPRPTTSGAAVRPLSTVGPS
jgi:hypothetical protein